MENRVLKLDKYLRNQGAEHAVNTLLVGWIVIGFVLALMQLV